MEVDGLLFIKFFIPILIFIFGFFEYKIITKKWFITTNINNKVNFKCFIIANLVNANISLIVTIAITPIIILLKFHSIWIVIGIILLVWFKKFMWGLFKKYNKNIIEKEK